ncbi:MAG: helix-turn-helix domain-containing protein [Yersinia sp. (in: enterobacteria)]
MQFKNNKTLSDNDMSLKRIGENLNVLMGLHGVDAQNLSKETGIGIATINNLRRGTGNPTIATLSSIADFFQVNLGSLTDIDFTTAAIPSNNIKTIPMIRYNDLDNYLSKKTVFTGNYTTEVDDVDDVDDDSLCAIEITNNALSPELERGTLCVISLNGNFCDGDIVLVKIKGFPICLRRVFVGDKGYQFANISLESDSSLVEYTDYAVVGVLLKTVKRLK